MRPKAPYDAETPLLSQAGNPFPPGLTPVFVPLAPPPPGRGWESVWPRPLEENPPPPDFSGCVTTDEYLYAEMPPAELCPRFKLRLTPRAPHETEAQYEWYRRSIEDHYRTHGVYLGVMQSLASHLGNFRRCGQRDCYRAKGCVARRDEDHFELSLAVFPPCIPLDLDIIESYREAVRAEMAWLADNEAPDATKP